MRDHDADGRSVFAVAARWQQLRHARKMITSTINTAPDQCLQVQSLATSDGELELSLTETRGKPRPSGRGRIAQTPKASCVSLLGTEGSTAGHAERKACGANVRPEAHGSENTVKRPKAVAAKQEPARGELK